MLTEDEFEPRTKARKPRPLDGMSIEELRDYVVDLKAEIDRAEAMIASKKAHLDSVSALFKTPS